MYNLKLSLSKKINVLGMRQGRDWDAPELARGLLDRYGQCMLSPWRDGQ